MRWFVFTLSCLILLIYISTVSANATESLSNEEDYTGDASHLHYERTDNFEEEYEEEDDEALEEMLEIIRNQEEEDRREEMELQSDQSMMNKATDDASSEINKQQRNSQRHNKNYHSNASRKLHTREKKKTKSAQETSDSKHQQNSKMSPTSKISLSTNQRMQSLDSRLDDKFKQFAAKKEEKNQVNIAIQQRHNRYKIPRKYASIVERILKDYNGDEMNNIFVDFYKLLQVSKKNFNLVDLKKSYRTLALAVHPDKNPHPDAKLAFDALQDAYEVLSDSESREQYNKQLQRIQKQRAWSLKKLKNTLGDHYENLRSRFLVFQHRVKNRRFHEEIDEFRQFVQEFISKIVFQLEHIVMLPSTLDRMLFINEIISEQKTIALFTLTALVSFLIKKN